MKPTLSTHQQLQLLVGRGLIVTDQAAAKAFLEVHNYYRFSGYARYFQVAPHDGNDQFTPGITFDEIRNIYEADIQIRHTLTLALGQAELALRTHVARVIADQFRPYGSFLEEGFYFETGSNQSTLESMMRDLDRSRDRHILRYQSLGTPGSEKEYASLPIWSAVEAWSFGTLSRVIERGAHGNLGESVAFSMGVAKRGFAYRVRALVYLRNRCAHLSRLWNHSVVDAGPTPSNVRGKAKKHVGQFLPRSIVDTVASLDDLLSRSSAGTPALPHIFASHESTPHVWQGFTHPESTRDHHRNSH